MTSYVEILYRNTTVCDPFTLINYASKAFLADVFYKTRLDIDDAG